VRSRNGIALGPAEMRLRAPDALAPCPNQRGIEGVADEVEYRAGRRKEKIAARQAPGVDKRQTRRDVQSSLSGANRTPRSSRISPSRLNSE
jgi:hypothetical protein